MLMPRALVTNPLFEQQARLHKH